MQVRRRSVTLIALTGAFFIAAGAVAAAGAGFSATSSLGSGQQTVGSPCTSVAATLNPSYDATEGYYKVASVGLALTCAAGEYVVRVTLGTGGSTYVERSMTVSFQATGSTAVTVTFPTPVKVSDVANVAALVLPL